MVVDGRAPTPLLDCRYIYGIQRYTTQVEYKPLPQTLKPQILARSASHCHKGPLKWCSRNNDADLIKLNQLVDIYAQPELRVYLPGIEERHVVAAKFSGFVVDLNLTGSPQSCGHLAPGLVRQR